MNQAPTQEKPNAYLRKTKTAQFIYIIEKVGLMNQAPTECEWQEGGFDKSNPKKRTAPYNLTSNFFDAIWLY